MSTIEIIKPGVELLTPVSELRNTAHILEKCGRTCYKSEKKLGVDSEKFIRGIVKRGHESVIEHRTVSMRYVCDRACSHQLVRHRLAALSQESQRYCNYSKDDKLIVIIPPSIHDWHTWISERENNFKEYKHWLSNGIKPEDARSCLPNACKTEVVATYNMRMWRHVISERGLNNHAQWQIKSLFQKALTILNRYLPYLFSDQMEILHAAPIAGTSKQITSNTKLYDLRLQSEYYSLVIEDQKQRFDCIDISDIEKMQLKEYIQQ